MLWGRCPATDRALYFPILVLKQCLAGEAGWSLLSPKHAGSSRERSLRGRCLASPMPALPPTQSNVPAWEEGVKGGMGGGDLNRRLTAVERMSENRALIEYNHDKSGAHVWMHPNACMYSVIAACTHRRNDTNT